MIIYIDNNTEDGIYAEIKIEIIPKIPPWESDHLDFSIWNDSGWFGNDYSDREYQQIQPYNNNQDLLYEGLYCAFSFDAIFHTPNGVETKVCRDLPYEKWEMTNGVYNRGLNSFGILSYTTGNGKYSVEINNFYLHLIKKGHVASEKTLCPFPYIFPIMMLPGAKPLIPDGCEILPTYEITTQCSGY